MKAIGFLEYLKGTTLRGPRGQLPIEEGGSESVTVVGECFKKNLVPARRREYHAGTLIFSETDRADGMYFIESGMVRVTRKVPEIHSEISLALLGPEECFGIISFMMGKPRTADARAVTDCILWQVDKEAFREIVTKNPEFAQLVIQGLLKRLEELHAKMRETTEQMTEFTRHMEDMSNLWHSLVTWG
ncbi:MAG TPA: Crp/Fnr family transcriptional regulator [Candidatus Hypogeohydataceae bacterium YC41]